MSEKPQLDSDASIAPEGPTKPPARGKEHSAERSESEQAFPRRVSRETQEAPVSPEQAMLNEIMDRSMNLSQAAPEEETEKKASGQEEAASPAVKNKPSSAYIYLAVLFGAAFLMLLLAYFVQQRNNDAVLDDLRSTTASREELLEEIERLEKENNNLQKDVDLKQYSTEQARELYKNQRKATKEYQDKLYYAQSQLSNATILWHLERFINEKDYLMAAAIVNQCDHYFNKNSWTGVNPDALPTQITRYMELRAWLYDNGHIAIYNYSNDPDHPSDQPVIAAATTNVNENTQAMCTAARNLWGIFQQYPDSPEIAATLTAAFYHPNMGSPDYLNTKNFKPSTIAMLEEIKADLMDRGFLIEQDDMLYYAEDGKPVDFDFLFGVTEEAYEDAPDENSEFSE